MSLKIMALCWPLRVKPPAAKSILIAMADYANDEGACWPSIDAIGLRCCLSKRAVIDGIKCLETYGVVEADRSNGRHTRYVIAPEKFRQVNDAVSTRTAGRREQQTSAYAAPVFDTGTGANAATPVQMPHRPEVCTSADAAPPPVQMPHLPVQMPPKPVRHLHSNHQEPSLNHQLNHQGGSDDFELAEPGDKKKARQPKTENFDPNAIEIPDWLPSESWLMWCRDRQKRKKPITEDAARLQLKSLEKLLAEGYTAAQVIENAIAAGWSGLFRPSGGNRSNTSRAGSSSHSGFAALNYHEGINDDGSFTAN